MPFKVLIADNDKITQRLVKEYLSKESAFSLIPVYDGEQALNLAIKLKPDIILAYIDLPLIDGQTLVHKIRNSLKRKIPYILSYTDENMDLVEEAIRNGITDIIKKPFNRLELLARLNAAVKYSELIQETSFQRQQIDSHADELNKLSLIVKQTANSVVLLSVDGKIEWVNDGFTKLYGYTFEELMERFGGEIKDFVNDYELTMQKINEVLTTKQSVRYVNTYISPSGQRKWIQTTLTPIFEGNKIEKIVAIETDITKEKEAEFSLLRQKEEFRVMAEELQQANAKLKRQQKLLDEEREKIEELLKNILPKYIIKELSNSGYARPRSYRRATVMFADFKGFTLACKNLTPEQIVNYLNFYFLRFDDIILEHYIEKIKTIGDAYMCVGGIPVRNRSNPFDVVLAALEFQQFVNHLEVYAPDAQVPKWQLRIGIHTGPLVAGVVGKVKFAYDVWGDTVNTAQRLQTACEPGRINVSASTYKYIKDYFECEPRGMIEVKHGGKIEMYYVNRIKPEYSEDGVTPNEEFHRFLTSL